MQATTHPLVVFGESPGPRTDPRRPLYPHTPLTSGGRLATLLGLTRREYALRTTRYNALAEEDKPLTLESARQRVGQIVRHHLHADPQTKFIVLGKRALACMPRPVRGTEYCAVNGSFLVVPHPSGVNRWYNSALNSDSAATVLRGHLAAAGGLGVLPPNPAQEPPSELLAALAEALPGAMQPPAPYLPKEEFDWLMNTWHSDTWMHSSPREILASYPAKLLGSAGLAMVPHAIAELLAENPRQAWGLLFLLERVTKCRPFPPGSAGHYPTLVQHWL